MQANLMQFDQMFTSYLPQNLSERFRDLLKGNHKRWAKIDPWKLWELDSPGIHPLPPGGEMSLREFGSLPNIAQFGATPASILCCGHAAPALREDSLHNVLIGNSEPFPEGFVYALQGRLCFAFNHDGGQLILCHEPPLTFPSREALTKLMSSGRAT